MKLAESRINSAEGYVVGYLPYLNSYVLEILEMRVVWYKRYYRITEDEYRLSFGRVSELTAIVKGIMNEGCTSDRFLFSEHKSENNAEQQRAYDDCYQHSGGVSSDTAIMK